MTAVVEAGSGWGGVKGISRISTFDTFTTWNCTFEVVGCLSVKGSDFNEKSKANALGADEVIRSKELVGRRQKRCQGNERKWKSVVNSVSGFTPPPVLESFTNC